MKGACSGNCRPLKVRCHVEGVMEKEKSTAYTEQENLRRSGASGAVGV
ncbi:hypothetical protein ARMA_2542 [Ardenticatena maritima]|uniref:Uncharacterized protein n=1 Tax=Ardenticatena maritima TaxID=872965 RepID=A0A0M8KB40_9CHLR|nr:hypothetical protein ARMA_2542 [Ardenticatena maritima]